MLAISQLKQMILGLSVDRANDILTSYGHFVSVDIRDGNPTNRLSGKPNGRVRVETEKGRIIKIVGLQ